MDNIIKVHEQTDYLLNYPEEISFTIAEQSEYLQKKADSDNEIEFLAEIDGNIIGTAGIKQRSPKLKLRHRCDLGISIDKEYWGLGIGSALLSACIECAKKAGYEQIELVVVSDNKTAVKMYEKAGFIEFGRNERNFKSRLTGYQVAIYMRMEL